MAASSTKFKPNLLIIGSPYWSNYLICAFNERSSIRAHGLRSFWVWLTKRNKAVCLVGLGPPDNFKRKAFYLLTNFLFVSRIIKLKAIYWIGTDVTRLKQGCNTISGFYNFAGSPWLAQEISDLGYQCSICYFPVRLDLNENYTWPISDQLTVLCYVPDHAHQLHGSNEILYLAKEFPNVQFNVVGGTGCWCKQSFGNLAFLGWCKDVKSRINESHILLRRTTHDSFSAFVREGLAANRYVIFSYEVPGVIHVKSGDFSVLYHEFSKIATAFELGDLKPKNNRKAKALLDYESQMHDIENIFLKTYE
jgi:hypothetical protein